MAEKEGQPHELSPELYKRAFYLMVELAAGGFKRVETHFSGSGDDGSIHDIYIDGKSGKRDQPELAEKLEQWAYDLLDETGVDWYNNCGGHGDIEFDAVKRTIKFDVNQYEEISHCVIDTEVQFGDWEETALQDGTPLRS